MPIIKHNVKGLGHVMCFSPLVKYAEYGLFRVHVQKWINKRYIQNKHEVKYAKRGQENSE